MDTGDHTDEALMLAYAAGDAAAFERLYDRHERPLHRYFLRQGVPAATADDLLQDTFMTVVRGAARYRVEARFTTWLYTLARSRLIDHWRASGRLNLLDEAANDDDPDASWTDRVVDLAAFDPERQALSREYALAFVAAVEALPPPQREAFLMHADGDLTLEEIATVSAVGVETVKSRLRYAMRRLRQACDAWLVPDAAVARLSGVRDEA